MNTTYELNNLRKDADMFSGKFTKSSPVVEIFAAMVNGEEISKFGKMADKTVEYVKELGTRSSNGDPVAIAELNTLRRYVIEGPLLQEMKLLGIFGSYKNIGFDETVEREIYTHAGERSRMQAANGDVLFPVVTKERYTVPTFTVSGGYAVDYRRVALGDMSKENEALNQVKIDIRNRALAAIFERVYKAIKNATGVKYMAEDAGLTKTNVDAVLAKVRRIGKPTVIGDYALLSQFTDWAGYVGTIANNTITGVSEKVMNELAQNGLMGMYRGAVLTEMPNPYDYTRLNAKGDNFETMLPAGVGFVVPAGGNSPIATWTRGGLTSFTGNNVANGMHEMRMDLEVAVDVAKGHEFEIGILCDKNLSDMDA